MKIFFSTLELKGTIYYLQVKNHWTIKIIGQKSHWHKLCEYSGYRWEGEVELIIFKYY